MTDFTLSLIFRWMHILAAIVAVGGTFFLRWVLLPSAEASLTSEQHQALHERIVSRWKIVIMVCIGLLLVSGVYNFFTVSLTKAEHASSYHPLFGIKSLAALGVFFVASVLTGRSSFGERMRSHSKRWLTINLALAAVVILISGVLKNL